MRRHPIRFDQNRIWCALVQLAMEITAWTQMLALAGHEARRWEPKRLRLFSTAARLVHTGRRRLLHYAAHDPWSSLLVTMLGRLRQLAAPG